MSTPSMWDLGDSPSWTCPLLPKSSACFFRHFQYLPVLRSLRRKCVYPLDVFINVNPTTLKAPFSFSFVTVETFPKYYGSTGRQDLLARCKCWRCHLDIAGSCSLPPSSQNWFLELPCPQIPNTSSSSEAPTRIHPACRQPPIFTSIEKKSTMEPDVNDMSPC